MVETGRHLSSLAGNNTHNCFAAGVRSLLNGWGLALGETECKGLVSKNGEI